MREAAFDSIGCIVMASGLSERYRRDKLLETLDGKTILQHTVGSLTAAGLKPLVVTRSPDIQALAARAGIACVRHDGPRKCDTMRVGLENLPADAAGYLFMPADQPLVLPDSLRRMADQFLSCPGRAVRLAFGDAAGSPVLFPAACRGALLAYAGDRGGADVLKARQIPCDAVRASYAWELWDVDTPGQMERVREAYRGYFGR